jgi:hypothetical protein
MRLSTLVRSTALLAVMATPLIAQTPAAIPLSVADSARLMELGHKYTLWILTGRADSLAAVLPADVLERLGGAAGISEQLARVDEHAGAETAVLEEKMTRRNGRPQFWHSGVFSQFVDEPLVFRIVFDEKGKVAGIGMGPLSQAPVDQ